MLLPVSCGFVHVSSVISVKFFSFQIVVEMLCLSFFKTRGAFTIQKMILIFIFDF